MDLPSDTQSFIFELVHFSVGKCVRYRIEAQSLSTAHQAQFHNISFQKVMFLFESVIILYPLYFVTVLNAKYGSQQTYHALVSINGPDKLPF